jgi:ribonuclease HII
MMTSPNFFFERKLWKRGCRYVVGVDEVGRGAFAGPIVVGAVIFPKQIVKIDGLNDSKLLKPRFREQLAKEIKEKALAWDVTAVGVSVINKIGIGKATEKAMRKTIKEVIKKLSNSEIKVEKRENSLNILISQYPKCFILIDYFYVPYIRGIGRKNQLGIKHGDQKSFSIAAASILAKVHRDKIMRSLARRQRYKKYLWGKNKGYGTKVHLKNILRYGLTRYHRKQFVESWRNERVRRK